MSAWPLLALAVIANVTCNVMLKKLMASLTATNPLGMAAEAIVSPWFWGGGLAGGVLLGSYLMAIRRFELSAAYAIVTSGALAGITLAAFMFLGESASPQKIGGVALVIAGIVLLARTQGA